VSAPAKDRGMATVTVIGLGTVLSAAAALGIVVGGVVTARHRAGAAADFAAIAAAQHAGEGSRAACRAAALIASANGAAVELCRLSGWTAEVRVSVPVAGPFERLGPARATARAGPVSP
jgi:secretion/DNA translocation related TadE-like protein